jgi:hypothetical protein
MLRLSRQTANLLQPFVIGLATIVVFVSGKQWPEYEVGLWAAFLTAIGIFLYIDLRKPVDYTSMTISDDVIEYVAFGQKDVIRLDEITGVRFVRELAAYEAGIVSKWIVYTLNGKRIELAAEWPHKRQVMDVFAKRLPGFDVVSAKKGLRAWKKGVWLCYESQAK